MSYNPADPLVPGPDAGATTPPPVSVPPAPPTVPPTTTVPPSTTGTTGPSGAGEAAGQVASTAADRGSEVAGHAAEQAKEVASAAAEQARTVASQASDQARRVVRDAADEVRNQSQQQAKRAADSLRSTSSQLQALAEGRTDEVGQAGDWARQAANRLSSLADQVEQRGVEGILQDVGDFARKRPGVFLLGAAFTGFAVGRLVKNAGSASSGGGTGYSTTEMSTYATYEPAPLPPVDVDVAAPPLTGEPAGMPATTATTTGTAEGAGWGEPRPTSSDPQW